MRFVIIATDRTGSSHLTNRLNSQGDILCNGEVFHPRTVYVKWPKSERRSDRMNELMELRSRDPIDFIQHIFLMNFGRPHVGFKIFKDQNDHALHELIDDTGILKLILYRRNVLANYSSKKLATISKEWHVTTGVAPREHSKVFFDRDAFIAFHNSYTSFYRSVLLRITSRQQRFQFFTYEEINDPQLFAAMVCSIGADATSINAKSRYVKQNSSDILSRFTNPADVEQFMRERNLMHWAHEGDTSLELLPLTSERDESEWA
jgi:hypothetical protein